jgi:DNA polymerase-3 subunit delta'
MRELKEETKIPPLEASRKVFIIEDAHKMLPTSSNALLKTLEEPASGAVIILIAPSLGGLLPTVVSRCCKIAFPLLKNHDIVQILMKNFSFSHDQAQISASYCFGSLDRDFSKTHQDTQLWEEELLEILLSFKESSLETMQQKMSALEEKIPRKSFEKVYEVILYFIKDLTILKQGLSPHLLTFQNHEQALKKTAHHIKLSCHEMQVACCLAEESHLYHTKLKSALEALLLRFYQE